MEINNNIWNVIRTRPRAEKKINNLLIEQDIETFLPIVKEVRQWSDRKKTVEVPLINSYIFIKSNNKNYLKIIETYGVLNFIKFNNKLAVVTDDEINNLKILISSKNKKLKKCSTLNFTKGEEIEIKYGDFKGLKGKVILEKNKLFLVVNIIEINLSFTVELSKSDVVKL